MNNVKLESPKNSTSNQLIFQFLVLLPIGLLMIYLILLSRYSVDIPFLDDWSNLIHGQAGSLSLDYLFRSENDTMSVTGHLLDSLSIRYLSGDNITYQLLSMSICLGGLLWLQFILLKNFTQNKTVLAFAFLTTIFMLQPYSYWGLQSLAYHQALPLLGLLFILYLHTNRPIKNLIINTFTIALLATMSGLSYISGAIAITTTACWVFFLSFYAPTKIARQYFSTSIGLLIGALLSLPIQLYVILAVQEGKTHRPDAPWAFPTDIDFWMYLIGKVSRAIGFLHTSSTTPLILTFLIIIFSIFCLFYLTYLFLNKKESGQSFEIDLLCIYGALFIAILFYLFILSAGRANLRPDFLDTPMQIFSFGQQRFHFFWVTLLLPWLALIFGKIVFKHCGNILSARILNLIALAIIVYAFNPSPIFSHSSYFKETEKIKVKALSCLKEKVAANEPINCPRLATTDLTTALRQAIDLNLSFTKNVLPLLPELDDSSSTSGLVFKLSTEPSEVFFLINASEVNVGSIENDKFITNKNIGDKRNYKIVMAESGDSQILFYLSIPKAYKLRNCRNIEINIELISDHPDVAQLFYKLNEKNNFTEENSIKKSYTVSETSSSFLKFTIPNVPGIGMPFRFDPGNLKASYEIKDLEIYCYYKSLDHDN